MTSFSQLKPFILSAFVMGAVCVSTQVSAQETKSHLYSVEIVNDKIVRNDLTTGEVTICADEFGEMKCTTSMAQNLQNSKKDLEARIIKLENRVRVLERALRQKGAGQASSSLPSDKEFNRAVGMMETLFKRFGKVVQELDNDEPVTSN